MPWPESDLVNRSFVRLTERLLLGPLVPSYHPLEELDFWLIEGPGIVHSSQPCPMNE